MALPSPSLSVLTKEDYKNLRKQQEKAKRDENAKQKISPTFDTPALSKDVSFDPPVKIEESEDSRKLKQVLGEYDFTASRLGRHGKYYDMVGVERQPATPLPSKQHSDKHFFSSSSSRTSLHHKLGLGQGHSSSSDRGSNSNVTHSKHSASESSSAYKRDVQNKNNHSLSSDIKHESGNNHGAAPTGSSSSGEVHGGRSSNHVSSHSKLVQKHKSSVSSSEPKHVQQSSRKPSESVQVKKEPAPTQPANKQPTMRDPVLQSIKQELMSQHKSNQQSQSSSDLPSVSSNSELRIKKESDKDIKQSTDTTRTVLKENNVVNGAKVKNRPTLNINVEEILKEFQVPKPLTGIHTPFKDAKCPFQDMKDVKVPSKDLAGGLNPITSGATVTTEPTIKIVEDIDDKDPSSSSSSSDSDDDDCDDDDDDDDESNKQADNNDDGFDLHKMMHGDDVPVTSVADLSIKSDVIKTTNVETKDCTPARPLVAEKVPPMGMDTSSTQSSMGPTDRTRSMCSSSESSSSSSESGSDVGSDSESDKDISDDEPQTPPQVTPPDKLKNASPSCIETTPPSRKWGLREFLPKTPTPASSSSKQKSLILNEAPVSDKSDPDHFDELKDMKRGADHISDDNPPSNDPKDVLSKPMSADEFSPPVPLDHKQSVLSPIKPLPPSSSSVKSSIPAVKSPVKHSFHQNNAAEKYHKSPKSSDRSSAVSSNKRDSISVTDKSVVDVTKSRHSRKKLKKPKYKSQTYVEDSDSDSDSEIRDTEFSPKNSVFKESPKQSLLTTCHKSPAFSTTESSSTTCSTKPLTSSAKRKESKSDKLYKDNDYVKLKSRDVPNIVACDSSKVDKKLLSNNSFTDPIERMLIPFPEEKPVSPIRNGPHLDYDQLRRAGIAVSSVKPVLETLSSAKQVKPVIVRLDLNILSDVLNIDKNSHNFLKPKSLKDHSGLKHQKLTSAKQALPSVSVSSKGRKVLDEHRKEKVFKSVASKLSANSVLSNISNDSNVDKKSYVPEKENNSNSSSSVFTKDVNSSSTRNVEPPTLSDDSSSDSSNSESENEDSKQAMSLESLSSSNHSSFNQSPDKKKRKLEKPRHDDSKRRKTSYSRSPGRQSTPLNGKEHSSVEADDSSYSNKSHKEPVPETCSTLTIKRERHNSASSQHSTHSNLSQRSSHSQRSSQSHKHKRARTHDESPSLKPTPSIQTSDRLHSTSHVTSVVKTEPVDTSKQNGYSSDNMIYNNKQYTSIHHCYLADKEDIDKMSSTESYSKQAKRYKHQADEMKMGLTKFVFYWESSLCFILCGCAFEKDHKIQRASSMYQDILKFIGHQYQQFQMFDDSEHPETVCILKILCLRIQALVTLKLYYLKRNETVKMKRILDDNFSKSSKSTSQPKPPSAPSPHQPSWNRSTGTPSPMSPTPSPANSVCSVGSVGSSDQTPSKICNGTSNQSQIPAGSVIVPQRIHSITQQYLNNSSHLVQGHEFWNQANSYITSDETRDFFAQLDLVNGPLTLSSSLLHLVRYVRKAVKKLEL
ncbi:Has a role in transcriptional regulation [Mactra antiquata]